MRGVYEAVTNSCLSVLLDSTEEPFSQRLPSTNGFKDHGLLGIDPETGEWVLYAADVVDYLKLSEGRDGSLMRNGWLNWYGHEYHSGQHTRLRPDGPSGWLQFNRPITLYKNYHVRLLAPKAGRPVIFRWQDDTPCRALSNILKKSADNDPGALRTATCWRRWKGYITATPRRVGLCRSGICWPTTTARRAAT